MKLPGALGRTQLPPVFWLVLGIASLVAAIVSWQDQRIERLRPPPSPATAAPPAPAEAPAFSGPAAAPVPQPTAAGLAAPRPDAEPASTAGPSPDPRAGRQVLRCVIRGRVTYRDLNAGCPEGASERITVFPTEGVGRPQ